MRRATVIAFMCAAALTFSAVGCGSADTTTAISSVSESETDYSNQTLTGEILSINGSEVTLTLGEVAEAQMGGGDMGDGQAPDAAGGTTDGTDPGAAGGTTDGTTPPEKPEGDSTSDGQAAEGTNPGAAGGTTDGTTPPEKPEGDSSSDGQAAEGTDPGAAGGTTDGTTPPEKPEGDGSSDGQTADSSDGSAASSDDSTAAPSGDGSAAADGQTADGTDPGAAGDQGGNTPMTFTAGDETATIDLGDATITKDGEEITLDDLAEGDVIVIEVGDDNQVTSVTVQNVMNGSAGGDMGSGSADVEQGTSANTITEDGTYSDTTYTSTGDDENALRVDGATVTLDGIDVEKTDGATSNTENGDFYGMNAGLLATNGANVTITNATVNTSAQNGNGVFSYGSGTVVNISDSTITTTADNSGGIQTTGGGTTNASNLTVTTSGSSAAAIRSDRGGGTVNVDGGTYTSNGYNSPAIYSTADITVANAELTANNSEALVIEGENSITLEDCDVYGNMSDTNGTSSDENVHNVMIYQSMSGDAESGTSEFSMTGGSLTSNNGDMIYVTNTHCILTLSGVDIVNKDADGYLLNICGNSASHGWGTAGSNGAQVEFTADDQELSGDIVVDTISTLNMTMSNGTTFTGTINIVDNAAGGSTDEDHAVVTIEKGCTWTLTGDCTITSLDNQGTINFNGYTITLADGTVLSE